MTGGTVLFVHGTTMTPAVWDAQLAALPDGWSGRALTLPGHGSRRAEGFDAEHALAEVVSAARSEAPVHIVGQSLGGILAQHAALRAEDSIASLFLIGSVPVTAPRYGGIDRVMRLAGEVAGRTPRRLLHRGIASMAGQTRASRAFIADALSHWSPACIGAAVGEVGTLLAPGPYPRLGPPITTVTGSNDRLGLGMIGPLNRAWSKAVTDVRHHVVPDAKHNANQDAADTVNGLLLDHLAGVSPSEPANRSNRRNGASPR